MNSNGHRSRSGRPLRVGLFGLLGAGNIGNDASLEAVLAYLKAEHPEAVLGCMCTGRDTVVARYALPVTAMHWYPSYERRALTAVTYPLKALGKVFDAFRTLSWARRHDVVIVPGMGVLEASVPLRPWGFPYALLVLCAAGRLVGTRTVLLTVGAEIINDRPTRLVVITAARLAHYRSFRDHHSKRSMHRMGVDTSGDEVFADLAFGLPTTAAVSRPAKPGTVGVGVMAWHGGTDDRDRADEIHAAYMATITGFVRWLAARGRRVRLFIGDEVDLGVVREIIADLRAHRPDVDPASIFSEPAGSMDDLMRQMATVDTVVATRYHNIVCALKLAKPTLCISYAPKCDALMTEMGLGAYCHSGHEPDLDRLIEQFVALEDQRDQLGGVVAERSQAAAERVARQFDVLSRAVLPRTDVTPVPAGPVSIPEEIH